jgi:hypothetical protein
MPLWPLAGVDDDELVRTLGGAHQRQAAGEHNEGRFDPASHTPASQYGRRGASESRLLRFGGHRGWAALRSEELVNAEADYTVCTCIAGH